MSFDISLNCACCGAVLHNAETIEEGGTFAIGGSDAAELNVTYNYAPHFSFRDLDGMTGTQSLAPLEHAVNMLGTEQDPDYWKSTKGNAGYACNVLLGFAREHPDGVWRVE